MEKDDKVTSEQGTLTIDGALNICNNKAIEQKQRARTFFVLTIFAVLFFAAVIAYIYAFTGSDQSKIEGQAATIIASISASIGFVGIFITQYRYHMNEASRMEFYYIAFLRIRVAAKNIKDGWQTDVRSALTRDAFDFVPTTKIHIQRKNNESPIPGHFGSDIATELFNKLTEHFDKKSDGKKKDETD